LHTKDEFPGSGLGLAITQKIVENLSGEIDVKSKPGVGTTFTVALPVSH
ncbi:MAG: signal transduction histidine kinase, partial [Limisphaerales bacterium]